MPVRVVAFREEVYFDQLMALAEVHGWRGETIGGVPVRSVDPNDVDKWFFVWSTRDGVRVEYVYDEVLECDVFHIRGERAVEAEAVIRESFAVLDTDDAASEYREDLAANERHRLLQIIAALLPEHPDERIISAIMAGLHDELSTVRFAALVAANMAGWAEFRDRTRVLSEREPDPNVRVLARNWLRDTEWS